MKPTKGLLEVYIEDANGKKYHSYMPIQFTEPSGWDACDHTTYLKVLQEASLFVDLTNREIIKDCYSDKRELLEKDYWRYKNTRISTSWVIVSEDILGT